MPVTFHSEAADFSLDLNTDLSVRPLHCTLCGGQGKVAHSASHVQCQCGLLERWATDAAIRIEYDAEFDEYHLMLKAGAFRMIYFCPSCGGRTPESKRGDFFTKPSQTDIQSLSARVRQAKTLDEVVHIIGQPDDRHGPITHTPEEKRTHAVKNIKSSLVYWTLSSTVCLIVQEDEDGRVNFRFTGQYKQKPKSAGFICWLKKSLSGGQLQRDR